jgi:hypothetical protein
MKVLLAAAISLGMLGVSFADGSGIDDGSRATFYFEMPLTGGGKSAPSTFGLRLESGQIMEGKRWPLLDWQTRERRGSQLAVSGVPILRYDGSVEDSIGDGLPESLRGWPWWGWALAGAATACVLRIGICKKSDDSSGGSGYSSPGF